MNLTVRQIAAEETIAIRHRVMWPDAPREKVMLSLDHEATHFGAFINDALVGVASFFPQDTSYRLRKLAVEPQFQGNGIARALIETAIGHLRDLNCEMIWCDARVSAIGFYTRTGFEVEKDSFVKDGLDYVIARRTL